VSLFKTPVRILIVDDSDPVRRGVGGILALRAEFECCGEARDGAEGLEKNAALQPDLVLLDVSMPGVNGLDVARLLREQSPAVKILILSQHDAAQLLPRALQFGANGCVDKSRLAIDLLPTIDQILSTGS
jgi:DNA-binding NarL/FixJ family response regulator